MSQPSKTKTFKIIMSIMIPLLIVVTTVVMVGASFAWFSNADKVTITEITMSTAESYKINFTLQENNQLWDNMEYVGQTAFCDIGDDAGKLMTKAIAGENTVDISNRPYYFINTVALDTTGNTFDMNMAFDTAKIVKYKYQKNPDGTIKIGEEGKPVKDLVEPPEVKKTYGIGENPTPPSEIPYAFTWFFKPHSGTKSQNYTSTQNSDGKVIQKLKQPDPQDGEVWYTPYGKLEFAETSETVNGENVKNVYVSKVNEQDIDNTYTITAADAKKDITKFKTADQINNNETSQMFDFYIVFAPEKLFWMQYFKADVDKYTAAQAYGTNNEGAGSADALKKIFGNLSNQMFYSSRDYSGSTFEFSAVINVTGMTEEGQG